MIKDLLSSLNSWRADDVDEILKARRREDRFVETTHAFAGDLCSAWMRIADDRVASGHHVDKVASQSWQRMGDRSDRSDDTKRSVLGDHQAV